VLRVDDRLFTLCGLSWAAGLIHVAAAITHLHEYALYSVFFEVLALTQFGWGIALYRAPSRRLLGAGAVLSVLVVALWIASRTVGLPIGPEPWHAEAVGPTDALASADEAILALLVAVRLWSVSPHGLRRHGQALAHGAALCLILFSSLALTSGHAHS
jgi:hypothetical protein